MSILVGKNTRVLIQGITGLQSSFHTRRVVSMGTNVVAGVSPNIREKSYLGIPVFSSVHEAAEKTHPNATLLFVPASSVKSAVFEALNEGIKLIVSIAYGVPILDVLEIHQRVKKFGATFIGPNTPGIITPNEACLGVFPEGICVPGGIGIISRSSTLAYEAILETNRAGFGESTVIGIGDDMIAGISFNPLLDLFFRDDDTKAVVLIGTTGGTYEQEAAEYYKNATKKKLLIVYITGLEEENDMGYASDILTHGKVTALDKKNLFQKAGATVIDSIDDLHLILKSLV